MVKAKHLNTIDSSGLNFIAKVCAINLDYFILCSEFQLINSQ